ncbi:MAG: TIGR04282 family arsenosugar biosynthesis glycosyltransferase [Caldilinea sp.]
MGADVSGVGGEGREATLRRALFVVAKQPAAGQTKTRLCPPLRGEEAAVLYSAFLADTLDIMRSVPDVHCGIAYLPHGAEAYFRTLAPEMTLYLQQGESLGERLAHLITQALENGAAQAVVMDSDSPTLPPAYVAQAFDLLDGGADAVFGPCRDGGYYLVGMTRPLPTLLREVQMSTPTVLADTLAIAAREGVRVALLPEWYDVDTGEELAHLTHELHQVAATTAQHTRRGLAALAWSANGDDRTG